MQQLYNQTLEEYKNNTSQCSRKCDKYEELRLIDCVTDIWLPFGLMPCIIYVNKQGMKGSVAQILIEVFTTETVKTTFFTCLTNPAPQL